MSGLPHWLMLIAVGIVLLCASYYITMPPEIKGVAKFFGVVCVIFGALLGAWVVFFGGAV